MRRALWVAAGLAWSWAAATPLPAAEQRMEVGGILLKEGPLDRTRVSQQEWAWTSGAESYPCISLKLDSGRALYEVRHDRRYSNGAIGIAAPTRCNWYESGAIDLLLDGKRVDLLPSRGETVALASGKQGTATLSWEDERARVTYTFLLRAKEDRLFFEIALEPKRELKEIEVRLVNYPGGFNRAPQHLFRTAARALEPKGWADLDPAREAWVLYADESLDVATDPGAAGPSALAYDATEVLSARVAPGVYGVPTLLKYRPTARRLRLCFWEFPRLANTQALDKVRAQAPETLGLLRAPETFARE